MFLLEALQEAAPKPYAQGSVDDQRGGDRMEALRSSKLHHIC